MPQPKAKEWNKCYFYYFIEKTNIDEHTSRIEANQPLYREKNDKHIPKIHLFDRGAHKAPPNVNSNTHENTIAYR